jgi:hypothetical protein
MRRTLVGLFLSLSLVIFALAWLPTHSLVGAVVSATATPVPSATPGTLVSPVATTAGVMASSSAVLEQKLEIKKGQDITETNPKIQSKLGSFLDQNPAQPLNPTNVIQHAIRYAVHQGVPANVLVLSLLFPIIASFIATSRHLIGLEGFGVYTPAVLAIAFLSTGIVSGLFLFLAIIAAVTIGRSLLRHIKLQYLPRTALLLWLVSLTVFGLLILSPWFSKLGIDLITISIFPILVLILLSENFIDALLSSTQTRAIELTTETVAMAVLSAIFMSTAAVQRFVIINPEVTIVGVFIVDILVGRYTGLRLSELFRFKPILDTEE